MEDATSRRLARSDLDPLTVCDREPIHRPGAIQPHGLLLVADSRTLKVVAAAGDVEGRLAADWAGRDLGALLGRDVAALLGAAAVGTVRVGRVAGRDETFEVQIHASGRGLLVELEPAGAPLAAADILAGLDASATRFEQAPDLRALCAEAAQAFRRITGFDRVMIYQFREDEAGVVLAEAKAPEMGSFLNHHFPGGDVPRQARALYVRNRVRVIPDVAYVPAPLRPAATDGAGPDWSDLDMSDLGLRSVSPIHVQYLKNMGVGASASVSIVKDGQLWGLVACHHRTARLLPYELRLACQSLAGNLARQIRAKVDAVLYRERIRLRAAEDALADALAGDFAVEEVLDRHGDDLCRALSADGFAAVAGSMLLTKGRCPDEETVRRIAQWVETQAQVRAFSTHALSEHLPADSGAVDARASGLLALTVPGEEPLVLLWFRAEQVEVVNWAGNPHKASSADPQAELTPRASFAAWSETVRGRSRRWTLVETETAQRLAHTLLQARQQRRIRELNRQLSATVVENERLLQYKDHLMNEVNHRVQNSLQLVASFLRLQARTLGDAPARDALAEAERRIAAVGLVHRQLYGGEQVETVDLSRYLTDLSHEVTNSLGAEWRAHLMLDLAPVLMAADRAVRLGLILTELVLNTAKYAYLGAPGPLILALDQNRDRFRLVVADRGAGKTGARQGFGTVILNAMVQSLNGTLEDLDNAPGLRTVVTAPIGIG
ncbi:histidine kinase dimerization/phosphoacceptor domain -containing protein [Xanthobacter sp. V7C-4]|uniref:histidine kinase dimerization/phosphoacceptor domain -containing protein n=1 Tax=Xanthobacter autotrophicus (strain ATCC BAA-1158 / Py2) TaxID=78245 RepID=UPI0037287342